MHLAHTIEVSLTTVTWAFVCCNLLMSLSSMEVTVVDEKLAVVSKGFEAGLSTPSSQFHLSSSPGGSVRNY